MAASADAVAKALVSRDSVPLQPAGDYANVLDLSDQEPIKIVFLTDGTSRRVKLGRREIIRKHTHVRHFANAGRKSGTVIQALRRLGQRHVGDKVLAILRRQLNAADQAQLLKDRKHALAWGANLLQWLVAPP